MRRTLETFFCFDGDTDEDIVIRFDYVKPFKGNRTDPPYDEEIDIISIRRMHIPLEELDTVEWVEVCKSERIRSECLDKVRSDIEDDKLAAEEARNDARQD